MGNWFTQSNEHSIGDITTEKDCILKVNDDDDNTLYYYSIDLVNFVHQTSHKGD